MNAHFVLSVLMYIFQGFYIWLQFLYVRNKHKRFQIQLVSNAANVLFLRFVIIKDGRNVKDRALKDRFFFSSVNAL